jgi:hypothetical protein
MSLRADRYRETAADAKDRAARARNPSLKSAFEEVANGWLLLAEKVEWIDRQRTPVRDEANNRSVLTDTKKAPENCSRGLEPE